MVKKTIIFLVLSQEPAGAAKKFAGSPALLPGSGSALREADPNPQHWSVSIYKYRFLPQQNNSIMRLTKKNVRNLTYLLYFKYVLRFLLGLLENHYKAYLANTGNEQGNKHCKVNK